MKKYILIGIFLSSVILFATLFSPRVYYLYEYGLISEPSIDGVEIVLVEDWYVPFIYHESVAFFFGDSEARGKKISFRKKIGFSQADENERISFRKKPCSDLPQLKPPKFEKIERSWGILHVGIDPFIMGMYNAYFEDECLSITTRHKENFLKIVKISKSK